MSFSLLRKCDFDDQQELLKSVIKINNEYRSGYELDDREKEQHVSYNSTTEEDDSQADQYKLFETDF